MLFEHLESLCDSDVLVLDRGYPARWLIAHLSQRGRAFCMRVDDSSFAVVRQFLQTDEYERIVSIAAPDWIDCADYECVSIPTQVRLVRVVKPNGRVHALMTSLLDTVAFPAADFAALYHGRWRIEEAFKRLKHRLALENTSGVSWLEAQQDFSAKVLADKLHALAAMAAGAQANTASDYKVNHTMPLRV